MKEAKFSFPIPDIFIDYILKDHKSIKGGTRVKSFDPVLLIFNFQYLHQVLGSIGEIGVKDGKFFIGIQNLKRPGEKSLAIDIFDLQIFNTDGSGKRNEKTPVAFFTNLEKNGFEPETMTSIKKDSLDINLADIFNIIQNIGMFRFFSVDGGHTAEHTINDLKIAEQLVHNAGVIALDDYINQDWPGVHQGLAYYTLLNKPKFVPFMYAANKLFLCNYTFKRRYFNYLSNILESPIVKKRIDRYKIDTLYDNKIFIIHFHPNALYEYFGDYKANI